MSQICGMIRLSINVQQKRLDIQKKYYKKFSGILTPKQTYELLRKGRNNRFDPTPTIRTFGPEGFNTPNGRKIRRTIQQKQSSKYEKDEKKLLNEMKKTVPIFRHSFSYFCFNSFSTAFVSSTNSATDNCSGRRFRISNFQKSDKSPVKACFPPNNGRIELRITLRR